MADPLRVHVFPFVAEDRVARLHFKLWHTGEILDQRLGDAVAQIFHIWVAADVSEGHDSYRTDATASVPKKYRDQGNQRACREYRNRCGRNDYISAEPTARWRRNGSCG